MSECADATFPGAPGWRWPGEWEPHAATALTWPHNTQTWHEGLDAPRHALAQAIDALARGERIHLHCPDRDTAAAAADLLGLGDDVLMLHEIASDDAWCRDHGAVIVRDTDGRRAALNFGYNAWGGKYPPWQNDALIAGHMAAYLGIERIDVDWIAEGGAIDGNGQGVVMTTASCLLNTNRNPQLTRARIESELARLLGADSVLWLVGELPGDDTDAHIDNLARFVSPSCAVVVAPESPRRDFELALCRNADLLAEQSRALGLDLAVRHLPVPVGFIEQTGLPASYANFYVGNAVVVVPVFNDPADDAALAVLEACFPGRQVVPVDARSLVVGLGALHCLTQQVPRE